MRLALSILLIGTVIAVPGLILGTAVIERETRDQTAADRVGTAFAWPDDSKVSDPEKAQRILAEAAGATGSNIIRTSIGTSESGRTRISHYLYLEQERSRLFDEFTLAEGRWLTRAESRSGSAMVTSARSEGTDVVGSPEVLADGYDLTFAPLHRAFESLPAAGRYVIESPGTAAADHFLGIVHQRFLEAGVNDLTVEDLVAEDAGPAPRSGAGPPRGLDLLPYALAAVAAVLVSAILLRESKRIGVMRLVGHSGIRIWYRAVGRLQIVSVLAGLLLCGALILVLPGADASFAWTLAGGLLGVTALVFGATLIVGLAVVNRVHVGDLIKGGL